MVVYSRTCQVGATLALTCGNEEGPAPCLVDILGTRPLRPWVSVRHGRLEPRASPVKPPDQLEYEHGGIGKEDPDLPRIRWWRLLRHLTPSRQPRHAGRWRDRPKVSG
jgi:hypothetical protein